MSDLKLVPDAPTPLEKLLLDASRAEQPSDDHRAKLRAALGIGVPLSGPMTAPKPAAASAGAAGAPLSIPPATPAFAMSSALGKAAVGVALAALIGAFAFAFSRERAEPQPVAPPARRVEAPVAAPAPLSAPAVDRAAPTAVSPLPAVETKSTVTRSARQSASADAAEDLGEQIRLIEAARAGVAARDSRAALGALDSYAAKFPRGSFGQEATVLRIRAVDQAGDSARASAMARSFLARFPNSPHVARLKPIAERTTSR